MYLKIGKNNNNNVISSHLIMSSSLWRFTFICLSLIAVVKPFFFKLQLNGCFIPTPKNPRTQLLSGRGPKPITNQFVCHNYFCFFFKETHKQRTTTTVREIILQQNIWVLQVVQHRSASVQPPTLTTVRRIKIKKIKNKYSSAPCCKQEKTKKRKKKTQKNQTKNIVKTTAGLLFKKWANFLISTRFWKHSSRQWN